MKDLHIEIISWVLIISTVSYLGFILYKHKNEPSEKEKAGIYLNKGKYIFIEGMLKAVEDKRDFDYADSIYYVKKDSILKNIP